MPGPPGKPGAPGIPIVPCGKIRHGQHYGKRTNAAMTFRHCGFMGLKWVYGIFKI